MFIIYTRHWNTPVDLFFKYLLNIYYVLGTVLSSWGFYNKQKIQNPKDVNEAYILVWESANKLKK